MIDKSFKTRIIWSAHTFKGGNDISDKVIIIFDRVFQSSSKYNKVLVNKKVFIKAKISLTFDDDDDTSRNAKVRFLMHLIKEYFV